MVPSLGPLKQPVDVQHESAPARQTPFSSWPPRALPLESSVRDARPAPWCRSRPPQHRPPPRPGATAAPRRIRAAARLNMLRQPVRWLLQSLMASLLPGSRSTSATRDASGRTDLQPSRCMGRHQAGPRSGTHQSVRGAVAIRPGARLGGALEALLQHRQLAAAIGQQLCAQSRVRLAVVQVLQAQGFRQGLGMVHSQGDR